MTNEFTRNSIEAAIRLALLVLMAYWCYTLVSPFIVILLWAIIIAVAVFPLYDRLRSALGGRNRLAAWVYTLLALSLLITPTVLVSNSIVDTATVLSQRYSEGQLQIPPPADGVREWPLVGDQVYSLWSQSSTNLDGMLERYKPQLKAAGKSLLESLASIGGGVLHFILSIIISGVLLAHAQASHRVASRVFSRVTSAGAGQAYAGLARDTIRSVAVGVLGVAAIQAVLSALGMIVMGVPAWGFWSALILVLAIAQLPPILVLGFVMAYVFSVADTTPAAIFAIYCLVVSASDGLLKPMFLGRGMSTPTLVILLGAIGGMLVSGIIGLFTGAIILALGYELFMKWLNENDGDASAGQVDSTADEPSPSGQAG